MATVLFRSQSTGEAVSFHALGRGFLIVRYGLISNVHSFELLLPPWTSVTAIEFGQTAEELFVGMATLGNLVALLRHGQVQIFELVDDHFRQVASVALGDGECQSIRFDSPTTLALSFQTADKRGEDAAVDIATGEIRRTGLFANAVRCTHPSGKWMIRGGMRLEVTQPSLLPKWTPLTIPRLDGSSAFRSQLGMRPHFNSDGSYLIVSCPGGLQIFEWNKVLSEPSNEPLFTISYPAGEQHDTDLFIICANACDPNFVVVTCQNEVRLLDIQNRRMSFLLSAPSKSAVVAKLSNNESVLALGVHDQTSDFLAFELQVISSPELLKRDIQD